MQVKIDSPPREAVVLSKGEPWNHNATYHHCHFDVDSEGERWLFAHLKFGDPAEFEDCFFDVQDAVVADTRSLWLRTRLLVQGAVRMRRVLTETWKSKSGHVLRVTELEGEVAIAEHLKARNVSYILLETAPLLARYRFTRRSAVTNDFGTINVDMMEGSVVVTVKMKSETQLKNLLNLVEQEGNSFKWSTSKVMHVLAGKGPVGREIKLDEEGERLLKLWNDGPYPNILFKKALLREQYRPEKENEWKAEMLRAMEESVGKPTKAEREINAAVLRLVVG